MEHQIFFLRAAGVLGALAVVGGAFGAHGLETRLSEEMLEVYEVAVRYHVYHAIALLAVAAGAGNLWRSKWTRVACWAFICGTVVFSGTLYALALTETRWLGAITPVGGVALIAGWVLLACAAGALAEHGTKEP